MREGPCLCDSLSRTVWHMVGSPQIITEEMKNKYLEILSVSSQFNHVAVKSPTHRGLSRKSTVYICYSSTYINSIPFHSQIYYLSDKLFGHSTSNAYSTIAHTSVT